MVYSAASFLILLIATAVTMVAEVYGVPTPESSFGFDVFLLIDELRDLPRLPVARKLAVFHSCFTIQPLSERTTIVLRC
jgi:hypothetical protein